MTAQGIALGRVCPHKNQALKGRYKRRYWHVSYRPFRAGSVVAASSPGAMPRAGLSQPLRGEEKIPRGDALG